VRRRDPSFLLSDKESGRLYTRPRDSLRTEVHRGRYLLRSLAVRFAALLAAVTEAADDSPCSEGFAARADRGVNGRRCAHAALKGAELLPETVVLFAFTDPTRDDPADGLSFVKGPLVGEGVVVAKPLVLAVSRESVALAAEGLGLRDEKNGRAFDLGESCAHSFTLSGL
jgi:hypothetical protein